MNGITRIRSPNGANQCIDGLPAKRKLESPFLLDEQLEAKYGEDRMPRFDRN
jgi:hypothetical protein